MKNSKIVKAGILGAGGFTGQELIKIFAKHENVDLQLISSDAYQGNLLSNQLPHLANYKYKNLKFSHHPQSARDFSHLDVIFLAVPDETSIQWSRKLLDAGLKVIDISGAFRLKQASLYPEFYGFKHEDVDLLSSSTYGLTEIYRDEIKKASFIANPGCYATCAILPIMLLKDFLKDNAQPGIIIDAKSGTSGAGGRKEKDSLPYSGVNENFKAYRIKNHQHVPEIVQEISPAFSGKIHLNMTPHLLPLFRGLQTNTYIYLKNNLNENQIQEYLSKRLENELFARFYPDPEKINLRNIQGTNFIDFGYSYDSRTSLLQIISVLDNLLKGAAGQAVQNMNLMFGLSEHQALQ
jgi:N-acetyl-gamma-glutamyl-phosphate reductase